METEELESVINSGSPNPAGEEVAEMMDDVDFITSVSGNPIEDVTNLEDVSVIVEKDSSVPARAAKLIPVPGSKDSFFLSYDGDIREGDPIYKLPSKLGAKKLAVSSNITKSAVAVEENTLHNLKFVTDSSDIKTEKSETFTAANVLEQITAIPEEVQLDINIKSEDAVMEEISFDRENPEHIQTVEDGEQSGDDFFDDPGLMDEDDDDDVGDNDDEEENFEEWPENIKAKIDKVLQQTGHVTKKNLPLQATGSYKFSGHWNKPPKQEKLIQARRELLQQIFLDYGRICRVCFNDEHEKAICPILNPVSIVENSSEENLRYRMPDDIVFGASRVYDGKDSLFARDEIPAYTEFGPLEGRLVTMQDLASMGIVSNRLNVSNLWPLPIEHGQHEFDFRNFISTEQLTESNWLKFIKVESSKEEHPPYNVQAVYKDKEIYFVTTKEIEPGGELFLRPFEPPFRVYYNMHRLGELFYNYCSRFKCKPSADEFLQLPDILSFVRHQFLVHSNEYSNFSWAAIYNCDICGEDCFDKSTYQDHAGARHGVVGAVKPKVPNQCRFCGKVLKTRSYMFKHIKIHHVTNTNSHNVPCPHCGKVFKHTDYLSSHIKASHVEDPVECPTCNKFFKNKRRLKSHSFKVHKSTDKMKICDYCGDILKDVWTLKIHYQTQHKDVKCFPCMVEGCNEAYSTENRLKKHYKDDHNIPLSMIEQVSDKLFVKVVE